MPREIKSKKSKASGLGKGLENLMKVDSVDSVLPEKEIHELPISELVPNVDQPRKSFDDDSLATLAESIKNLGIFQPIVVRKQKNKYQIVHQYQSFDLLLSEFHINQDTNHRSLS